MSFFPAFALRHVPTAHGPIRLREGGAGPPLLLLHGHPRTHATWWRVAPSLARQFRVVCADLPGYGGSWQPADAAGACNREKAASLVQAMAALGHQTFALAGHDRGSYAAFRLAMDHPDRVTALALLDCVPILEALERADWRFARDWFHWFFFPQTERALAAITAAPHLWYPADPAALGPENHADFMVATDDPAVVRGMLLDYRAGLEVEPQHDAADRAAGRRIGCPVLLGWAMQDDAATIHGDLPAIWRPWLAAPPATAAIDSPHHMAEAAPEALADALLRFFAGAG